MNNKLSQKLLLVCGLALFAMTNTQAALFADNEARNSIIKLRDTVKTTNESVLNNIISLQQQIDKLQSQNQILVGENEALKFQLSNLENSIDELSTRLASLEPAEISLDGSSFTAYPAETAAYNSALKAFKQSNFKDSAEKFSSFLNQYPNSGYLSSSFFWLGTSYYALQDFKNAITAFNKLVNSNPRYEKAADALIGIANSQIELKNITAAKATLKKIITDYINTSAAENAKQRLSSLK